AQVRPERPREEERRDWEVLAARPRGDGGDGGGVHEGKIAAGRRARQTGLCRLVRRWLNRRRRVAAPPPLDAPSSREKELPLGLELEPSRRRLRRWGRSRRPLGR